MSAADPCSAFRVHVLDALGYAPPVIEPGRLHRFATCDRRGDVAGWCKLFSDLGGGVFGCHRRGISETWCARDRSSMSTADRAWLARQVLAATNERNARQCRQWAANARRVARMWAQCGPLADGDPASLYLQRRRLAAVQPMPDLLRVHRALPYWHERQCIGVFPALVAPLVGVDGRMLALHRTFLTTDGHKAAVSSPKKLTRACGPLAGACIPLFKPVLGTIGIAEGIETALAAHAASGLPTVAAYCAGNLAAWHWPRHVRRIVIFADADARGREAAAELTTRARSAGLHVRVEVPTNVGADWCDLWAEHGAALSESGVAS